MKLYGRRYVKSFIDRRVQLKTETRDAVVWDVDWVNYKAYVKIQGSNEYVMAHFPRNWKDRPYWLTKGNAVQIRHREGIKGYVEVIGEGRAIPTPVAGGSAIPPPESLPDMILTGLKVTETNPTSLGVWVESGSYRINGTVYYIFPETGDFYTMNDPPEIEMSQMGSNITMGAGIATVDLDPVPSSSYYRYDLLVVGTDSQIDYIKGTASKTNPIKPNVPAEHLQIGDYILVRWDLTGVTNSDIGAEFVELSPSYLDFTLTPISPGTFSGEYFVYCGTDDHPECTVKVTIKDQFGLNLVVPNVTLDLDLSHGTGDVWSSSSGYGSSVSQTFTGSSYNFKYRRDQTTDERSVAFITQLATAGRTIQGGGYVVLLNIGGTPVQY